MSGRAGASVWTLHFDGTKCDGHGICALRCPELITLDERGFAGVTAPAILSGRTLRRARRAAAACPERALALGRAAAAAGRVEADTKLPDEGRARRTGGHR